MGSLEKIIGLIDSYLASYWLVWILIFVAIYFSIRLKLPQIFLAKEAYLVITEKDESAKDNKEHISPFEAMTISLGTRVGIGSIVGVAIAIILGGPGAIFWMWVMAFIAGASSFAECTLAQVYKDRDGENAFKGGPAYYIRMGLNSKLFSMLFAVCLILVGWTFLSLYSNTAVYSLMPYFSSPESFNDSYVTVWAGGLITLVTAIMFLGGGPYIAKFTRVVTPFLAFTYILLTIIIILKHFTSIPSVIYLILNDAFSFRSLGGGFLGSTIVIGIQRALFATEAGMGSAPNAAASAHTSHPIKQGIAQAFIVFLDIVICTCSAFFLLFYVQVTGENVTAGGYGEGMVVMQNIMKYFYSFGGVPVGQYYFSALIIILVVTVSVGNYYAGQMNIKYISSNKAILLIYKLICISIIFIGAQVSAGIVWTLANITMTLICTLNLIAILLLSNVVIKALKDYQAQRKQGLNPKFNAKKLGITNTTCWDKD